MYRYNTYMCTLSGGVGFGKGLTRRCQMNRLSQVPCCLVHRPPRLSEGPNKGPREGPNKVPQHGSKGGPNKGKEERRIKGPRERPDQGPRERLTKGQREGPNKGHAKA